MAGQDPPYVTAQRFGHERREHLRGFFLAKMEPT